MEKYINKDRIVAEIERRKQTWQHQDQQYVNGGKDVCDYLLGFIDTLKVKEVDLEKEIELIKGDYEQVDVAWNNDFDFIARHFFELALQVNSPITAADRGTAEEIIINLKRVEQDYHIDLTREMEWVRNKVKKEEV